MREQLQELKVSLVGSMQQMTLKDKKEDRSTIIFRNEAKNEEMKKSSIASHTK